MIISKSAAGKPDYSWFTAGHQPGEPLFVGPLLDLGGGVFQDLGTLAFWAWLPTFADPDGNSALFEAKLRGYC